ncbi:class II lanthipeptide, LchA2/BrtA2 family [Streptomyces brasiliscabiei]|uniref:class II lanthipeptide, LchA2/BrtA2 family n=1 Tax=Streptomyces brasiliscabiei TaxID=2736302 RepID=UPI001C0F4B6C|nr:class II lanthipeptide, LchA2/BrtA2 family [Streptomyces brasiliscabiei]
MQDRKIDVLGGYDEAELIELSEADAYGGTGAVCIATVTLVTAAVCPTTKCTSKC